MMIILLLRGYREYCNQIDRVSNGHALVKNTFSDKHENPDVESTKRIALIILTVHNSYLIQGNGCLDF